MERIEIGKSIIEDIISGDKIRAIKKLREKFPFPIAHKIAMELNITVHTRGIKQVDDKIVEELNREINEERDRLLKPIGTSI